MTFNYKWLYKYFLSQQFMVIDADVKIYIFKLYYMLLQHKMIIAPLLVDLLDGLFLFNHQYHYIDEYGIYFTIINNISFNEIKKTLLNHSGQFKIIYRYKSFIIKKLCIDYKEFELFIDFEKSNIDPFHIKMINQNKINYPIDYYHIDTQFIIL